MRYNFKYIIPATILAAFLTACTNNARESDGEILVRVGNETLTRSELIKRIPSGTVEADSVRLARAFVRSWIDSRLVSEIAARNIGDMSEIDRLTAEYRNELIAYEYRRRMADQRVETTFSDDSLKAYYDANQGRFITTQPIVRGVYIKVPDNAPQLPQLRKLYRSDKVDDIDRLEKQELVGVIHYDYFRDRWVEWDQIEARIPVDFGNDPVGYLKTHPHVDVTSGGFTYLLDITDVIPKGAKMPFEFAREHIKRDMTYQRRIAFDNEMRRELLKEADENGELTIFCDLDS